MSEERRFCSECDFELHLWENEICADCETLRKEREKCQEETTVPAL